MLLPVEVYGDPSSDYPGVRPEVVKRMTDGFLLSFTRALESRYEVVSEPGADVLQIRCAITGVQLVKPLNHSDFIPMKTMFNVARSAAGGGAQVAEMTAEMEVLDGCNHRVAAAVATRKGDKSLPQGEQITWADLQTISNYWARGFRQRLDEITNVSPR